MLKPNGISVFSHLASLNELRLAAVGQPQRRHLAKGVRGWVCHWALPWAWAGAQPLQSSASGTEIHMCPLMGHERDLLTGRHYGNTN